VESVFSVVPAGFGQACVRRRGQGGAPAGGAEDVRPWGRRRARQAGEAGTKEYQGQTKCGVVAFATVRTAKQDRPIGFGCRSSIRPATRRFRAPV